MSDTPFDINNMSDEDLSNLSLDEIVASVPEDINEDQREEDHTVEDETEQLTDEPTESDTEDTDGEDISDESDTDDEDEVEESEDTKLPAVDFESEYQRLLTPFKANGKQIQVDSVDEAIKLMQMGANYHAKMASLKPARKIVKLLENNELLDERKINYLIDLHSQNPQAINQLLKDSKVDLTEVDIDGDTEYEPQARSVADNELELEDVLDSIKGTDTYSQTMNAVTESWDDESRTIVAQHPHILGVINQHMGNGIYDQVASLVDKQRQLGNLNGMSYIEAYRAMGEQLSSSGQLINQATAEPTKNGSKTSPIVKEKPQKASTKRRSKAAVKRSAPNKTGKESVDLYKMSDEEITALDEPPFKYV